MVTQQQDSWWYSRKNAKEARKLSEQGVYESHPTWVEYRALLKKYTWWAMPLAMAIIVGSVLRISKDGFGFSADINERIGMNLSLVGMLWVFTAVILVRVFRSVALTSYSKGFRQEARNLMERTSDPDPDKRWNTAQLVRHLEVQLSLVPQDGVILTNIVLFHRYSLTALIDAAERAKEEKVLQVILKFQKMEHVINTALLVVSALFSAIVSKGLLVLFKNLSGKDLVFYVALTFCGAALIALYAAIRTGQDPEKWVGAVVKIFTGIAVVVVAWITFSKRVDDIRENRKPDASIQKEMPMVSPKTS